MDRIDYGEEMVVNTSTIVNPIRLAHPVHLVHLVHLVHPVHSVHPVHPVHRAALDDALLENISLVEEVNTAEV
jgi:hypothetical protein